MDLPILLAIVTMAVVVEALIVAVVWKYSAGDAPWFRALKVLAALIVGPVLIRVLLGFTGEMANIVGR